MAEKKYLTVVFEYAENEPLPSELCKVFSESGEFMGCEITAISHEDEISRAESLENSLESLEWGDDY